MGQCQNIMQTSYAAAYIDAAELRPELEFFALGRLAGSQESFRILPFAAKLERTEILVPFS